MLTPTPTPEEKPFDAEAARALVSVRDDEAFAGHLKRIKEAAEVGGRTVHQQVSDRNIERLTSLGFTIADHPAQMFTKTISW
jgi:hypothetical protein